MVKSDIKINGRPVWWQHAAKNGLFYVTDLLQGEEYISEDTASKIRLDGYLNVKSAIPKKKAANCDQDASPNYLQKSCMQSGESSLCSHSLHYVQWSLCT